MRKFIILYICNRLVISLLLSTLAISYINAQRVGNTSTQMISSDQEFFYAFTEANKYYLFGNYVQAVTLYKECLKIRPESAAVHFQLSKIFVNAGNTPLAREYAKNACRYAKENTWYLQNLADIFQMEQKYDSAADILNALIALRPENVNYYFALSSLNEKLERYDDALRNLEQVDRKIGISREVILSRYRIYEATGQSEKAIYQLKEAGSLSADDYNINGLIAEYYRKQNQPDSARKYYNKIFPEYGADPLVAFSYAEFLIQQKKKDSAIFVITSVLKDKSIDNHVKAGYFYNLIQNKDDYELMKSIIDTIAGVYYNTYYNDVRVMAIYADVQMRVRNLQKSINVLKRIVSIDSKNYPAVEQLLYVLNISNKPDTLLLFSEKALATFQDKPMVYLLNGSAKYQKKLYSEAILVLKKGAEIAKEKEIKVEFYSLLAECYQQTSQFELSEQAFNLALNVDPKNSVIKNNYAYYLSLREKDLTKAEKMSYETIREEPENSTYLDTYAWVLFKMNKLSKARKYIDRAVRFSNPPDNDILRHASDIYVKLKLYGEAILYLQQMINSGNANIEEVQLEIERIKKLNK